MSSSSGDRPGSVADVSRPDVSSPDVSSTGREPVKMVIWDLDETLWEGTISEGAVTLDPARMDLVRSLNRRGIVNGICSKNDLAQVRTYLQDAGIWDEFVSREHRVGPERSTGRPHYRRCTTPTREHSDDRRFEAKFGGGSPRRPRDPDLWARDYRCATFTSRAGGQRRSRPVRAFASINFSNVSSLIVRQLPGGTRIFCGPAK